MTDRYNDGLREGLRLAKVAAKRKGRLLLQSRDRAAENGRHNVASHRQSDSETAYDIAEAIEALARERKT